MAGGSWSIGLGLVASFQMVCAAPVPRAVGQLLTNAPTRGADCTAGGVEPRAGGRVSDGVTTWLLWGKVLPSSPGEPLCHPCPRSAAQVKYRRRSPRSAHTHHSRCGVLLNRVSQVQKVPGAPPLTRRNQPGRAQTSIRADLVFCHRLPPSGAACHRSRNHCERETTLEASPESRLRAADRQDASRSGSADAPSRPWPLM